MKRIISAICTMAVLTLSLTACSPQEPQDTISKELGIDVSGGNEISSSDDHGGFHGDGTTFIVLSFSDDNVLKQINKSTQWKSFPLDKTVKAFVYGISEEGWSVGPFLTDREGNTLVPEIEEGYYLLIDRQAEAGEAAGADILHRHSFNFTLGLYDTYSNSLYFCKLDT